MCLPELCCEDSVERRGNVSRDRKNPRTGIRGPDIEEKGRITQGDECNGDVTTIAARLEYNSVMTNPYIPWLVLSFLCCVNAAGLAQRVTIRLINLNETPFQNKQVYVSGSSAQAASLKEEHLKLTGKPIRADLSLLTDAKGETAFDLPNPPPAYVYVRPVFSKRVWDCDCFARISTDELLHKGYIVMSPSAASMKAKPSIQPKGGEVWFVMRRTPLWWQLLYPIEKG
jgi:hypothetical protein